jgi:hypothetical protein
VDPVLLSLVQAAVAGAIGGGTQTLTDDLFTALRDLVRKARHKRAARNHVATSDDLRQESAETICADLLAEAARSPKFAHALADWQKRAENATVVEGLNINSVSGRVSGPVIQIGNRSSVETINLNEL